MELEVGQITLEDVSLKMLRAFAKEVGVKRLICKVPAHLEGKVRDLPGFVPSEWYRRIPAITDSEFGRCEGYVFVMELENGNA
jgi:hypothetical protein